MKYEFRSPSGYRETARTNYNGQTDGRTDRQTPQATTIPLGPQGPRGKKQTN